MSNWSHGVDQLYTDNTNWVDLLDIAKFSFNSVDSFSSGASLIELVEDPFICDGIFCASVKKWVIFKNLSWGLGLLQVDGENWFICKKPPTVS